MICSNSFWELLTGCTRHRLTLRRLLLVIVHGALACASAGAQAQAISIGVIQEQNEIHYQAADEWQWALRSGGVRIRSLEASLADHAIDLSEFPMIVIENTQLGQETTALLAGWVRDGGILLVTGPRSLIAATDGGKQDNDAAAASGISRLTGVSTDDHDPALAGSYPFVIDSHPLLAPLRKGDGLRLGRNGLGHVHRFRVSEGVKVLAESARVGPGPEVMMGTDSAPTITVQETGEGLVLFAGFSPAEVAACYPDMSGRATDCSAAGSARAVMRWLTANALWQHRGIQVVLPWEAPGYRPVGVVLTGDVHADEDAYQIGAAVQMARVAASHAVPVTFFLVGDVARRFPVEFAALSGFPDVEIATHSAHGEQYQRRKTGLLGRRVAGVYGAESVREDVRKAESMLGLPSWPGTRAWLSAIRTEAWGSNQTDAAAWSGLADAGIGLVFDHSADKLLARPELTAPAEWFDSEVRKRLFVPVVEKSVSTASDDFILAPELAGRIASVASPEPDPCCNDAVSFRDYANYVRQWHAAFRRIGMAGGLLEVWLWHPSTPMFKQGFPDMDAIMQEMQDDPRVQMFRASEVATWNFNRNQVSISPRYSADGKLVDLVLHQSVDAYRPLPPGSSPTSATVSFWVLGKVSLPGWQARHWRDDDDRLLTVLTRQLDLPEG